MSAIDKKQIAYLPGSTVISNNTSGGNNIFPSISLSTIKKEEFFFLSLLAF